MSLPANYLLPQKHIYRSKESSNPLSLFSWPFSTAKEISQLVTQGTVRDLVSGLRNEFSSSMYSKREKSPSSFHGVMNSKSNSFHGILGAAPPGSLPPVHKKEPEKSSIFMNEDLNGNAVHEETLIYLVREYMKRQYFGNDDPRRRSSKSSRVVSEPTMEGQENDDEDHFEGTIRIYKSARKISDFSHRAKALNEGVESITRSHVIQHAYDSERPAWMLETLLSQCLLPYNVVDELMKKGKFEDDDDDVPSFLHCLLDNNKN